MPEPVVPAYVLAGGRSTRMGRDKAFVEVEGQPMAARVARALRAGGAEPVHLVGKDPALATLGLPWVPDRDALHHPLVGAAAALRHARLLGATRALLCPCDLPWIDAGAIASLLAAGADACLGDGERVQPLCCVLPVARAAELAGQAARGAAVRAALSDLAVVLAPAAALRNVNRAEDLAAGSPPSTC
ncbi:NTP transferase domain-containing protein [Myxococcota bacterium]|nr:NTP transferase domain-containing protein [Myxococcota bacterium]